MRKALIALAAVPVVAALYVPLLVQRSVAARVALIFGAGAIIAFGGFAIATPRGTVATQAAAPDPIPAAAFRPIVVSHGLVDPIIVDFTSAMDQASVEAAMTITPDTEYSVDWSDDSTSMAVWPSGAWTPGTFHRVAIGPTAHSLDGMPAGRTLSSMFLTRQGVAGTMAVAGPAGAKALVDSRFVVRFDAPVRMSTAVQAFRSDPPVTGTWTLPPPYLGNQLIFTPSEPLEPGTTYAFTFDEGVADLDGAPLGIRPALMVETEASPSVVRFRPRSGWSDVPRGQDISVRFDRPMERVSTRAAFSVKVGGKEITGSLRWAEGDRVLILAPTRALPYGALVTMHVGETARSKSGAPLEQAINGRFRVVAKPVARKTTSASTTTAITRPSGGGSTGSATWLAVEKYYHKLLACTRGGGLVTSGGSCSSPGGSGLAPLKLDSGISAKVSRPYAKKIAQAGVCDHFYGGTTPGTRLKKAGYANYAWGENIGCRSGNAYSAVLGSHLHFQSERGSNGGHWKNMMNSRYDRVGIGVWVSSGRVRLVVDFYHP